MSRKLEQYGVILSTDEVGNEQIQRIDDAKSWMIENELECVQQLNSDGEAEQIVRELVIDNYIETIQQDLMQGDKSLLYGLLSGEGVSPIRDLSEQELITEAKELDIL